MSSAAVVESSPIQVEVKRAHTLPNLEVLFGKRLISPDRSSLESAADRLRTELTDYKAQEEYPPFHVREALFTLRAVLCKVAIRFCEREGLVLSGDDVDVLRRFISVGKAALELDRAMRISTTSKKHADFTIQMKEMLEVRLPLLKDHKLIRLLFLSPEIGGDDVSGGIEPVPMNIAKR